MVESLLSLPTWAGCNIAMAFTTVIGLVVYVVSSKFITKTKSEDLKEPIGGLFRVVGMLVSLMLSLAFGEVIVKLVSVRNAIDREVVTIADTNKDLELFDLEKTREIRSLLIYYTQALIDDEWPALATTASANVLMRLNGSYLKQ